MLTRAVARHAHRLFAFKDDYEVARLFSDPAFDAALAGTFEGEYALRFHLALPWQRSTGPGGEPIKRSFGPWMRRAMRVLAQGRHLRGTPLDLLALTQEGRLARALAAEYESSVERLLEALSAARLDAAIAIADWPAGVRGFGPVKARSAQSARARRAELLAAYAGVHPLARPAAHAA